MNPVNRVFGGAALAAVVLVAGCTTAPTQTASPRKETIHALTQDLNLLTIHNWLQFRH